MNEQILNRILRSNFKRETETKNNLNPAHLPLPLSLPDQQHHLRLNLLHQLLIKTTAEKSLRMG